MLKVFLSHNTKDQEFVLNVAGRLKSEDGIEPWIDKWNLSPGDAIVPELQRAMAGCDCCLIFFGPSGLGPWQNEEIQAAIRRKIEDVDADRFRAFLVLLPGSEKVDRSALPDFLRSRLWVEFPQGLGDERQWKRLLAGIRGEPTGPGEGANFEKGENPYMGLRPFGFSERDTRLFHGRQSRIQWLAKRVADFTGDRPKNRFLVVTGPSGSGKSSLVMAGLFGFLQQDGLPDSRNWLKVVLRPGSDPIENLCIALGKAAGWDAEKVASLTKALRTEPERLRVEIRMLLEEKGGSGYLVLAIDQLEELDTEALRNVSEFLDAIIAVTNSPQGRTIAIGTLRSDYLTPLASTPQLTAILTDNQEILGGMTLEELREAIERPAVLCGGSFEDGLVDLLLNEFEAAPGALPLLQHCLFQLWRLSGNGRMTLRHYQQLGRIEGSLNRRATEIYDSLPPDEQGTCRKVFLRLINISKDSNHTKRRESVGNLATDAEEACRVDSVLERFAGAEARLLIADNGEVEIAHEALIRGWNLLRAWIDQDRDTLEIHRELVRYCEIWESQDKNPDSLLKGRILLQMATWASSNFGWLNSLEREFLLRSLAQSDLEMEEWSELFSIEGDVMPLAREYLEEQQKPRSIRAAIRLLRNVSSGASGDEARILLAGLVLGDHSGESRRLAVRALFLRGDSDWFIARYANDSIVHAKGAPRKRLLQGLGYLRIQAPEAWETVSSNVIPALRLAMKRETVFQILSAHRNLFALVIALSFGLSMVGWALTSTVSETIYANFSESSIYAGNYLYWEVLSIAPLLAILTYLLRLRAGRAFTWLSALKSGMLGGAIPALAIYLIPFLAVLPRTGEDFSEYFRAGNRSWDSAQNSSAVPPALLPDTDNVLADSPVEAAPPSPDESVPDGNAEFPINDLFPPLNPAEPPALKNEFFSNDNPLFDDNSLAHNLFRYTCVVVAVILSASIVALRVRAFIRGNTVVGGDVAYGVFAALVSVSLTMLGHGELQAADSATNLVSFLLSATLTAVYAILFLTGVRLALKNGRRHLLWRPSRILETSEARFATATAAELGQSPSSRPTSVLDESVDEAKGCWHAILRLFFWAGFLILAGWIPALGYFYFDDDLFEFGLFTNTSVNLGTIVIFSVSGALFGAFNLLIPFLEGARLEGSKVRRILVWIFAGTLWFGLFPFLVAASPIVDLEDEPELAYIIWIFLWVASSLVWNFYCVVKSRSKPKRQPLLQGVSAS